MSKTVPIKVFNQKRSFGRVYLAIKGISPMWKINLKIAAVAYRLLIGGRNFCSQSGIFLKLEYKA